MNARKFVAAFSLALVAVSLAACSAGGSSSMIPQTATQTQTRHAHDGTVEAH